MNHPKPLKKGDRIEIVSPAGRLDPALISAARKRLVAAGFVVSTAPHAAGRFYKYAGSDAQRLGDLQTALDNPEVKAVLCARGGYGSMRFVDQISFEKAAEQQKWLIGFSDITALHAAAFKQGLISLHGLMAKDIVHGSDEAVRQFLAVLQGTNNPISQPAHPMNRQGRGEGPLIGGNMSMLYALRGTPFDIDWKGAVLFVEDLGENLYHLDRIMQNFRLSGKLNELAGFIVGQFNDMGDAEFGKTAYEIIEEAVTPFDYPVIYNFPVGHVSYSRSLTHGHHVRLEAGASDCILRFQ
ncbi:MAG TPA: LD-carboxypeptidase [Bacteroidales bacterium]|nr:LD-carboxypeptidase [Bacteroidales bacterium]